MADNEYRLKLIAEATSLIAGFKASETATDKLKTAIISLEAANKQLAKAEDNLTKARESGDQKSIKSAEKVLEQKSKLVIQAEKDAERQIKAVEKEADAVKKAEEKKRQEIEKTQKAKEKETKGEANELTKGLGGIGNIEQIATAVANPIAAIGLLIEAFNKLSEGAKEAIKGIGEKFSEFILGFSEGTITVESFLEGIKGNIAQLGEEFGFTGTIAATFANTSLSVAQAAANIVLHVADEQKVLRGLNQTLDISTATLRGYETALSQAGISVTRLPVLLVSVNTALEKLKEGSPKVVEGFKAIGLSLKDLEGLNTEEKFKLIFERIRDLNAVNKEAAANATFAITAQRRAVEPIDLIARNYERASKSVERFGAVVSKTGDKDLVDLGQSLLDLNNLFTGVRVEIAEKFAPQLKELADIAVASLQALKGDPAVITFFKALGNIATVVLDIFKGLILAVPLAFDALRKFERLIPGLSTLAGAFASLVGVTEDNKKAAEELAEAQKKEKEALHATEKSAKELEETLRKLEEQSRINTKNSIAESEKRITQIEREEAVGKKSVVETGEEILALKQELSQKLIAIEEGRIAALEAVGINDVDILEKVEKAKTELAKLRTDREKIELDQQKQNQKDLSQETISQAKITANELQAIAKEAQANITDLENEGTISHEEAARQRAEVTRNQIEFEIQQNNDLLEDDRLTNDERRKIRENLSKLEQQLGQADLTASREINKAKQLDDKETADNKKKVLQEAIREIENSSKVLLATDKAFNSQQKNNIDDVVDKYKRGELDKQSAFRKTIQLELESINFSISTQLNLLSNLTKEQQKLRSEKQDTTKVDDDIILANQRIADLQRTQGELQKALKGQVDGTSEAVNKLAGAFGNVSNAISKVKSGEDAINENVAALGDRAKSAAATIADAGAKIAAGGEYINSQTASIEDLTAAIDELREHAKVIDLTFAFPGKDVVVADINASADKLQQDLINRTQRVALEAEQKRAEEALRVEREKQQKLFEVNQERLEKLEEAEKDFEEKKKKLAEDTEKENIAFVTREKERNDKLNEDKLKAEEDFKKKENEIRENAAKQEEERQRKLVETKEKIQLDSADKLNDILRRGLVERATLEAQINAEKDPKKKAELEKQLAEVTAKGREKENREKEKQAELDTLLRENLTDEELKAKQEAIERKYKLDEDADEQRQALIKSGSEKALKEFDRLIAEQKARDEKRLADELQRIKDAAKRKADQEAKERQERLDAYNQRLKDLDDAFKKERQDAQDAHDKRLNDIKEQQKQIRNEYLQTQKDIEQSAIDSAAQIGVTGKAIQDAFGLSDEAAKAYLATLNKIGEAQGAIASGLGSSPTSSGNTATPTSGGIGNNSGLPSTGSSSPFGGSSTTGSGSIGASGNAGSNPFGKSIAPSGTNTTTTGGNNQQTGVSKDKPSSQPSTSSISVPSEIKTSNEYSTICFSIYDTFEKELGSKIIGKATTAKQQEVYQKLANNLFNASFAYAVKGASLTQEQFKAIAPSTPYLLNSRKSDENKRIFSEQIKQTIQLVEKERKPQGADKGAGIAGDIPTKSGDITTPGLSSDVKGGTKGNVGSSPLVGSQDIGSITSGQPTKDPVLAARDAALDTGYEGEGAESRSTQAERAAMQAAKDQNAGQTNTVNAPIQNLNVSVGVIEKVSMTEEEFENALIASFRKSRVAKQVSETVNGNNTQNNFNRNPAKFIAK